LNDALSPGITQFLSNKDAANYSSYPKAFLNWVLFDNQFHFVQGGVSQVKSGTSKQALVADIPVMPRSGYLFIYLSNESSQDVFFDQLVVHHRPGSLLAEDHYYPFGLEMVGISDRAMGRLENRYRYNGMELNEKEFADGSGLDVYTARFRGLDVQIGRWWQIDPKQDYVMSTYATMGNNPILYSDPLGDTLGIQFRTGFPGLGGKGYVIYNNGHLTNPDGSVYKGKIRGFLKRSVNALNAARSASIEASSMIGELQSSENNFTIVKGNTNRFDYHPSQRIAAFANQLKTDPNLVETLANTPVSAMQGGAGGTITWNPNGENVWVIGGKQDNNPTINLMHELFHGRDANRGLLDDRKYMGLGRDEWQAVYKENIVRKQMGLSLREYYISQDNAGVITPLPPRLLDANNNPIFPLWAPAGW